MRKPSTWMLVLFAAVLFAALPTAADAPAAVAAPVAVDAAADCSATTAGVAADQPLFLAGEQCGGVICGKGTYCCNPSCSRCVPFGMSCTQEACNSAQPFVDERLTLETDERLPVQIIGGGGQATRRCVAPTSSAATTPVRPARRAAVTARSRSARRRRSPGRSAGRRTGPGAARTSGAAGGIR